MNRFSRLKDTTGLDLRTVLEPPKGAPTTKSLYPLLSSSIFSLDKANPNPGWLLKFNVSASIF